MKLRQGRAVRWLTAFALLITLMTMVGSATAAENTDMFDPDVRLNDNFFPPSMGNNLIVTSACSPNGDLTQPSTITVASRQSGVASIPGASMGGWVFGNLTWSLQATVGGQTQPPVDEFWPFTIDGAPTGSHFLPTGNLTSVSGTFAIDRSPFGSDAGEDIAGTLALGPGGGWGVCRTYSGENSGSPTIGPNVTGSVHTLHAGELTYTVTQGPAGLAGETGPAAAVLMNSFATGNPPQCATPCTRIATGHFRLEFGTTIETGGSEFTDAGGGVAPVTVEPMPDVSLTFSDVTASGITNVVQTTDAPALPGGFQLAGDGLFYEIKTTATFTPPITVCFPHGGLPAPEILHFEGGSWVSVATTVVGDQACGQVNSLSPFAVGTSQQSPEEMIGDLVDKTLLYLDKPALKPALKAQLEAVAAALVANKPKVACAGMAVYIAAVKLAPSSAFTAAEKAELISDAKAIRDAIGC
jgi:hypothetical protein